MQRRDYRDLINGFLLILTGVWIAQHALTTYNAGTLNRIGPALFPASLGVLLAFLGLLIAVPAWLREGRMGEAPLRPMFAVLIAITGFALLVDRAGLLPAVVFLVAGAILADNQHSWRSGIMLTVVATAGIWLVFSVLLGVSFRLLRWPL